ncbi:hypothetical protein [Glacieibacterium sp.]|uniref:hypothetical protein n=1 Tax=Glacieibacterium sp. TaxID=2860237 RepID=UPI003B004A80
MRTQFKAAIVAAALFAAGPAFADAASSFHDGKWQDAITQGRAENTAASLVLAGRAALSVAGFTITDKAQAKTAIAAAERDFDAAIAKAPNNLEARVQKAIAVGYRAKLDKSPGEAKDTRRLMEAVLARDPNNALGNAALGGWHGGAVATLGNFIASTILGANRKDMERCFSIAMARDPKNIVHPLTYAFTLLDISTDNAPQATQLLKAAVMLPSRDAYEVQTRKVAVQVLAALNSGDAKGARALARRLQPFGTVS